MHGPVFANMVLADEINRAPPKTQAAMLEAMQEQNVTVVGKSFRLDLSFLVLATQTRWSRRDLSSPEASSTGSCS